MIIELEKYKALPEGSEIPDGEKAVNTLKKTLQGVAFNYTRNEEYKREVIKNLTQNQEASDRYLKQIAELKRAIDVLMGS